MKKIINNKRYDTEKAEACGSDSYSYPGDFNWWAETLYQKRTGEFFLHGEGGPMSRYAVTIDQNSWSGGEKIMPLSLDAARQWAEKHLDADAYEKLFGEVTEDEGEPERRPINLSLPTDLIRRLRQAAAEKGVSVSDLVAELAEGRI